MPILRSFHEETSMPQGGVTYARKGFTWSTTSKDRPSIKLSLSPERQIQHPESRFNWIRYYSGHEWQKLEFTDGSHSWEARFSLTPLHSVALGRHFEVRFTEESNSKRVEVAAFIPVEWRKFHLELPHVTLTGSLFGAKLALANMTGEPVAIGLPAWRDSDHSRGVREYLWHDDRTLGEFWPIAMILLTDSTNLHRELLRTAGFV